jgi:hypothetical protein
MLLVWRRMKRTRLIVLLLVMLEFVACSAKDSATSVIRVRFGDSQQIGADKYFLSDQRAVLTSEKFLRHVSQVFDLPNLWKQSEGEAVEKLRGVITVQSGNEPGVLIVTATGLDHQLAVRVLNELCSFRADEKQGFEASFNGGPLQKVHVEVIKRAE